METVKDFCGKASTMDFTTAVDWFKDELRSPFSRSFLPPDRLLLPMSARPLPTLQAPYMRNSLHISTKTQGATRVCLTSRARWSA
jgi:hypothetical protein